MRPVSPHLTIYKPQFNSILSIFNRITSVVLSVTTFVFLSVQSGWILHTYNYYLLFTLFGYTGSYGFAFLCFLTSVVSTYHALFGLEGLDVPLVRPKQLERFDEYDLTQLYYLFTTKLLFVLAFSFLITTILLPTN